MIQLVIGPLIIIEQLHHYCYGSLRSGASRESRHDEVLHTIKLDTELMTIAVRRN